MTQQLDGAVPQPAGTAVVARSFFSLMVNEKPLTWESAMPLAVATYDCSAAVPAAAGLQLSVTDATPRLGGPKALGGAERLDVERDGACGIVHAQVGEGLVNDRRAGRHCVTS